MPKEYFSHDYHSRNKKRVAYLLIKEKIAGYGLFWIIVEMLHEESSNWMDLDEATFESIAKESGCKVPFVKDFISRCIETYEVFIAENNRFTTDRVLRNIDARKEVTESKRKGGLASAEKRRNAASVQQTSTDVQQDSTGVQHSIPAFEQKATKETKGKETKLNNLSANALPVSSETVHQGNLAKEYDSLRVIFPTQDENTIFQTIKDFVFKNKPALAEPYADAWNIFAPKYNLASVREITKNRRDKLRIRTKEESFDFFQVLAVIRRNEFYRGESKSGWKIDFDHIIESQPNYIKIIEKMPT